MRAAAMVFLAVLAAVALGAGCAPGTRASRGGAAPVSGDGAQDGGVSDDGPILPVPGGRLKIQFCAAGVVRVASAKDPAFFSRSTLITAPKRCSGVAYRMTTTAQETSVATSELTVRIDRASGGVTFFDPAGRTILAEKAGGGRTVTPAVVQGEATQSVRQEWSDDPDEALYGLGQHQHGQLDIKGTDLDLRQYNTEVFIPFLVSSKGYGILWDNTSFTRFGDLGDPVALPGAAGLYADAGLPGDVRITGRAVDWSGVVTPAVSGDYTFRAYSTGAIQLYVNGREVIDHFRQDWLPNEDIAHVTLTAGRPTRVRLSWTGEAQRKILRLLWKPPAPQPTTSLWSEVGDGIDYWFVYGPELDRVISGYRRLTGEAPMMPRWAFGFWQSRERYSTAQEVVDVLKGYRDRGAPLDNIVQDWRYWPEGTWGSHEFDPQRYPDPAAWIATIHENLHAQVMVSVWPKFYPGTANYEALRGGGFLYPLDAAKATDFLGHLFTVYDAFNPAARRLYWSQIDRALFSRGVDAWWLDASEPELVEGPFDSPATAVRESETHMNPTALGSGSRMLTAFPLVNSQAVYEGQRTTAPNRRVFILTRSGFAGQQRYAAATWSGDITSTWTAMRKQVPAGLGFSLSGVPYWTLDSGGFSVPSRFASSNPKAPDVAEWRELNTRWFEYATFLPLLRVHGQSPPREIWQFGGDQSPAYAAMLRFDRLRYRLLPYVYSLSGAVTREAGTMLRPLVMDFRTDRRARTVDDQFMFGPAFLVSPITTYLARTRQVYLPAAPVWYDFWTGRSSPGSQTVAAAAPFDAIPVHVRAGSIVPVGPELQYASEKPADPITLYVYAGADGEFTLYEDDGTSYDYERGGWSTIPLRWANAKRTLTIGARTGRYPGMLAERAFRVVLVTPAKPSGFSFALDPDPTLRSVTYHGAAVDVVLDER